MMCMFCCVDMDLDSSNWFLCNLCLFILVYSYSDICLISLYKYFGVCKDL